MTRPADPSRAALRPRTVEGAQTATAHEQGDPDEHPDRLRVDVGQHPHGGRGRGRRVRVGWSRWSGPPTPRCRCPMTSTCWSWGRRPMRSRCLAPRRGATPRPRVLPARPSRRAGVAGPVEASDHVDVATFDTRVGSVRHLPGSAARAAGKEVRRHHLGRLVGTVSFYVDDMAGPLLDGRGRPCPRLGPAARSRSSHRLVDALPVDPGGPHRAAPICCGSVNGSRSRTPGPPPHRA